MVPKTFVGIIGLNLKVFKGHVGSPMESNCVGTINRYLENRSANEDSEITK